MSKKIIGLVGPIAAGKGTVAAYLADKYQAKLYGFSAPLRDIVSRLHLEPSRANLADLSTCLRAQFGQDLISKTIRQDMDADTADTLVLDGIRRPSDIALIQSLPGFVLWAVNASAETRYRRLTQRQQNSDDQQKTFEQFLTDEQSESDKTIADVMNHASLTLDNSGDLDKLHQQIDNLMSSL